MIVHGLKASHDDIYRAQVYTDNQRIAVKLWDEGFSGHQSAEWGPIMQKVRELVFEAFVSGRLYERANPPSKD